MEAEDPVRIRGSELEREHGGIKRPGQDGKSRRSVNRSLSCPRGKSEEVIADNSSRE